MPVNGVVVDEILVDEDSPIFKFRFMRGAGPTAMRFLVWRLGMTIAAKPLIVRLLKDLLAIIGLCSEGRFDGLTTNG